MRTRLVADTPMVYVPGGVDDAVVRINVEESPALTRAGRNVAVTPDGRPLARKETKRACRRERLLTVVRIRSVTVWPCVTDKTAGVIRAEKVIRVCREAGARCDRAAMEIAGAAESTIVAMTATR